MRRVKIRAVPKAKDGVETKAKMFNGDQLSWPLQMNQFSTPEIRTNRTLKPVDEEVSNLEAEKGERAIINQDGLTTNFNIGGKRHSQGGTPLNLPKNSFIFSDTKDMKIKDPTILAQFGITSGVYTPADIAKKYDINKFRATLADPDSSDLDRKTAEMMIANFNLKLAKLALVQESKKGFPQGIPAIAMPYVESMEINPGDFLNTQSQQTPLNPNMAQYGAEIEPYLPAAGTYNISPLTVFPNATIPLNVPTGNTKSQISPEEYIRMMKAKNKDVSIIPKPETKGKQYEVELTPEEAKALGINAYGGTLHYQEGGGTGKKKYTLTPEQYLKLQAMKKGTTTSSASTKPTSKKVATPTSEFDPYGQSLAELESYLVPGASLRKGKVSTHQSETTKGSGVFGDAEVSVDQFMKNNPGFATEFKTKHPGEAYNPKNQAHVEEFQNFYNPNLYKSVYDQFKKRGADDVKAKQMADLAVNEFGFKKGENVKDFDKKHGQFTGSRMELQFKEQEAAPAEEVKMAATPAATPPAKKLMPVAQPQGHDPWWLQDIIKTAGATSDFFGVKKYSPWQATPGVTLAEPTFYDPTRELAANTEMANIGTQGLTAFTNPQAFAAGFSQIQGQAGKNAADILGKYNNMNVGVANDFEIKNNDIMNQSAATLAGLSTQLADKYTILNQQFDNSKNMARQNIRQSYIDAITNKNYTANMNDLYDQYKVDPIVGGRIKWTHGRPLTPGDSNPSVIENINSAATEFMKMNPGLSRDKAFEAAMKMYGSSEQKTTPGYDPRGSAYPG